MVQVNFFRREANIKIVYYGPGLAGKTTSLEIVAQKTPPTTRGELTSIATEGDRTLMLDYWPLDLPKIGALSVKLRLFTVPGQCFYNSTRRLILQGADGVIFVADSQTGKREENLESWQNLRENLQGYGLSLDDLPIALQCNKRDLRDIMSVEEMVEAIHYPPAAVFPTIAIVGQGVLPGVRWVAQQCIEKAQVAQEPVLEVSHGLGDSGMGPISGQSALELSRSLGSPAGGAISGQSQDKRASPDTIILLSLKKNQDELPDQAKPIVVPHVEEAKRESRQPLVESTLKPEPYPDTAIFLRELEDHPKMSGQGSPEVESKNLLEEEVCSEIPATQVKDFHEILQDTRKSYSSEEAIQELRLGKPLKHAVIPLLELSGFSLQSEMVLEDVSIGCLRAAGAYLAKTVKLHSVLIERLEMGGVYHTQQRENILREQKESFLQETVTMEMQDTPGVHFGADVSFSDVIIQQNVDFRGARFDGALDWRSCNLAEGPEADISLREAVLNGPWRISDCTLGGMDLRGARVARAVQVINTHWQGDVNGWNAHFGEEVDIKASGFHQKARFRAAVFEKHLYVLDTQFDREGFFGEAVFRGEVSFYGSHFAEEAHFHLACFADSANFSAVTVTGSTVWSQTQFQDKLYGRQASLGQWHLERAICAGEADFSQVSCTALSASYAVFQDIVYFTGAHFSGRCEFTATRFEQRAVFKGARLSGLLLLNDLDASNVIVQWSQVGDKLQSQTQRNFAVAAAEYSLLKTIFERQNQYDDMDEAYFRGKQMERQTLRCSLATPLQTIERLLSFWVLDLGCGYGTRPLRITITSLFIMFAFSVLYCLVPDQIVYLGPPHVPAQFNWTNALYFSIATFTTVGFGDWAPHPGSMARFLVTLEAFVGIFTMALFVAAFTRKVIR